MFDTNRVKAGLFPGLTQTQVHADHGVREDLREEVINVSKLRGHVGLLMVDFAGAPETFERDLDLFADRALLGDRPHVIFATDQQLINLAVNLEDRGPLGFGRVSGQHGLDAHPIEALGDLLVGEAGGDERTERATPRAGIRGETVLVLTESLGLRGGILLDHVQ